ncbi:MAG: protein phosphatase 2C domain-containing protein [Oscillospiraceae bacterium]|nr:protein phosphatase 2C domain-containing protein [Oscillospiraceae bacterium]
MTRKKEEKPLSNDEVTAHTASMWKYLLPPDFPEPYPEYMKGGGKNKTAEVTAARVRGKKHKHEGTNCDDWVEYRFAGDIVIAAVSDGAGSKPLSRIGAKTSCAAVADSLQSEFNRLPLGLLSELSKPLDSSDFAAACSALASIMQNSFKKAFNKVNKAFSDFRDSEKMFEHLGRVPEINDFAATLLAAAVIPVNKEFLVISVQVGDGAIATVNPKAGFDEALCLLGAPDSGSFAGETEFLISPQIREPNSLMRRTMIKRGKMSTVLLMSDGVADDYYPAKNELLRLYLDLELNGILQNGNEPKEIPPALAKAIPAPIAYPWVNDSDISYSLQYTSHVMEKTGLSLAALWENHGARQAAALKSFGITHGVDKAEALSVWLDNYSQRGSFDDRALVVIELGV